MRGIHFSRYGLCRATVLAHPTNVALKGDRLYTANLGRWHVTEFDLAALAAA